MQYSIGAVARGLYLESLISISGDFYPTLGRTVFTNSGSWSTARRTRVSISEIESETPGNYEFRRFNIV